MFDSLPAFAERFAGDAGAGSDADAVGDAAAEHGLENHDRCRLDERRV